MVSVVARSAVDYPDGVDYFSPDERYPEYRSGHMASTPNPVYRAVRDCLIHAGLDAQRLGSPGWNPLGEIIHSGSRVFVLCNFVCHRRPMESQADFWSKCSHGSVLRAVLDYVLLAAGPSGRVIFGNAPVQSCNWKNVLQQTGARRVLDFYAKEGARVEAKDLRLWIGERGILGQVNKTMSLNRGHNGVVIDLGAESRLDEIYASGSRQPRFRVDDYDPRQTERCHSRGCHRYVIHQEVLKADIVVSLPKLKTHGKVGLTCNLKGFVGMVGHKDCLAHHRFRGPSEGGDEYPVDSMLRGLVSRFHDWVQMRNPDKCAGGWQIVDRSLRRVLTRVGAIQSGSWYGNDTAWRMALDLARIARYADASGEMRDTPQRAHLGLVDGVIAGEGDGPLSPHAVRGGALIFGRDVAAIDWIACRMMGYDPLAIPIVREAFRVMRFPITDIREATIGPVTWNGQKIDEKSVPLIAGRQFSPPSGWKSYLRKHQ
jgi:uncharacterized protein (DUF362 family)